MFGLCRQTRVAIPGYKVLRVTEGFVIQRNNVLMESLLLCTQVQIPSISRCSVGSARIIA